MAITSIKNLKEFSTNNDRFEGAHLLCPGCAHSMICLLYTSPSPRDS